MCFRRLVSLTSGATACSTSILITHRPCIRSLLICETIVPPIAPMLVINQIRAYLIASRVDVSRVLATANVESKGRTLWLRWEIPRLEKQFIGSA